MNVRVLLTCEHGGNRIPARYRLGFAGAEEALASHRGFDPGALSLARTLRVRLGAPLVATRVSRLLVETNRSLRHADLFSPWSRALPREERLRILRRYYFPHRRKVMAQITRWMNEGARIVHVGVHSFTPRLHQTTRAVDVALLYDPDRVAEVGIARAWRQALLEHDPHLRVRRNFPYRGAADGLTTALRRRFPVDRYHGIELEVNNHWLGGRSPIRRAVVDAAERVVEAIRSGRPIE